METRLTENFLATPEGREADALLRACVHCGFCNATCPTYQLTGDELEGPRGRIYQIKTVLEGDRATRSVQQHLDQCLTCLSCETTCPSGVQYGRLLDIGRRTVDQQVPRPWHEQIARQLLRTLLPNRRIFAAMLSVGRAVRTLMPKVLRQKIVQRRNPGNWPLLAKHRRRVLLLTSCTQGALLPAIDRATARVLDRLGVEAVMEPRSGCCGALQHHLSDREGAKAAARRNIDAWQPWVESGVEALVMNASGCGLSVRQYGELLADDPNYSDKARVISQLTVDLSEWLTEERDELATQLPSPSGSLDRIAFHPPCTLQHGQRLGGKVEQLLQQLGADLVPVAGIHLCCGAAGTYSMLHPDTSHVLGTRRIEALTAGKPREILSANVGCLAHLEGLAPADVPVRHWIEWIDSRLSDHPPHTAGNNLP